MPDAHEFGIMQRAPKTGERYDSYEPQKYNCISIASEYIDEITLPLSEIEFYWHTVDVVGKGIAYCGITLISPQSAAKIPDILPYDEVFEPLRQLLKNAISKDRFVIHYGV